MFILRVPSCQFSSCYIIVNDLNSWVALREVALMNTRIMGFLQFYAMHRQVSMQALPLGNPVATLIQLITIFTFAFEDQQLLLFLSFPHLKTIITKTIKPNKTKPACKKCLNLSPTFMVFISISVMHNCNPLTTTLVRLFQTTVVTI